MNALLEAARKAWPFKGVEPLDMGVEDGIVWAISRAPYLGVNGYALIPAEGHPWSAGIPSEERKYYETDEYTYTHYATDDLEVHGGITYGGITYGGHCGPWIGFDTAHSGDVWPPEYCPEGYRDFLDEGLPWTKYWTVDMVREEAKSLARQVAAALAVTQCPCDTYTPSQNGVSK